jgi:hypothetical protein
MTCKDHHNRELPETQASRIKAEIEKTALNHLNSKNAISALSHYTVDAKIMSNGILYSSFESFAADIKDFYSNLRSIDLAAYNDMHIKVLASDNAHLSTKFHWTSTDINGQKTEIKGTWSALFILIDGKWKMCFRHESFRPV